MGDRDETGPVHSHPLEVISLTVGVLMLVMGVVFAVTDVDITQASVGWIAFGVLATTGLLMLAAAVKRHRGSATITPNRGRS